MTSPAANVLASPVVLEYAYTVTDTVEVATHTTWVVAVFVWHSPSTAQPVVAVGKVRTPDAAPPVPTVILNAAVPAAATVGDAPNPDAIVGEVFDASTRAATDSAPVLDSVPATAAPVEVTVITGTLFTAIIVLVVAFKNVLLPYEISA